MSDDDSKKEVPAAILEVLRKVGVDPNKARFMNTSQLVDAFSEQVTAVNPKKAHVLSEMIHDIWGAQPCYSNPADFLTACLLRAKLMRLSGERDGIPEKVFEEAERVAEELFQTLTKKPEVKDTNVH
jgi:hypothetical protein